MKKKIEIVLGIQRTENDSLLDNLVDMIMTGNRAKTEKVQAYHAKPITIIECGISLYLQVG